MHGAVAILLEVELASETKDQRLGSVYCWWTVSV